MTKTCWVVCDEGKVGTQNQCVGLAEALGFQNPTLKPILPRFPWRYLPARLWPFPLHGLRRETALSPPWPDLIVAAGRASVAPTAAIRRLTQGKTQVIQLQNPRINPGAFDAVIAPYHDHLKGPTVLETKGALHRVTPARLESEYLKFKAQLDNLPRPFTTVLLGGTNGCYQLERPEAERILEDIRGILSQQGGSLLVTLSRRTAPDLWDLIQAGLRGLPHLFWDEVGENPYFAFLQAADFILVTCDSVSMASEACATGKPVYVYPLPGGSRKFHRFHRFFQSEGYTRPFQRNLTQKLESWSYTPLNDFPFILAQLKKIIRSS